MLGPLRLRGRDSPSAGPRAAVDSDEAAPWSDMVLVKSAIYLLRGRRMTGWVGEVGGGGGVALGPDCASCSCPAKAIGMQTQKGGH